eukprot:scaffold108372_cov63-Phaeocystis_antarctica.AAC.3
MATMPNADEVDAYLCYHALEAVVDEAVNDAVLKQVAVRRTRISNVTASITRGTDPYAHIAMMLMKHTVKSQPDGNGAPYAIANQPALTPLAPSPRPRHLTRSDGPWRAHRHGHPQELAASLARRRAAVRLAASRASGLAVERDFRTLPSSVHAGRGRGGGERQEGGPGCGGRAPHHALGRGAREEVREAEVQHHHVARGGDHAQGAELY